MTLARRRANAARYHYQGWHLRIAWGEHERRAALLAMWGFGTRFIEQETGLTRAQIAYRLKQLGLNRARTEYRNGEGDAARYLLRRQVRTIEPVVRRHFKQLNVKPTRKE